MGTGAITEYVDVAQLALYAFWIFFAGLIYYLQRESKREGFPLETHLPDGSVVTTPGMIDMPPAKTFRLASGHEVTVPDFKPGEALPNARPTHPYAGAPLEPVGDPLLSGIGPGSWASRADVPDATPEGGPRILPLRLLPEHGVSAKDPDPRGMEVTGGDGETAGTVRDLWLDHMEAMFRYLEVEVADGRRVLVPVTFARITRDGVHVHAIHAAQFANVPATRSPDQITLLEEEKVCAYYGAGMLWADARRAEPMF